MKLEKIRRNEATHNDINKRTNNFRRGLVSLFRTLATTLASPFFRRYRSERTTDKGSSQTGRLATGSNGLATRRSGTAHVETDVARRTRRIEDRRRKLAIFFGKLEVIVVIRYYYYQRGYKEVLQRLGWMT